MTVGRSSRHRRDSDDVKTGWQMAEDRRRWTKATPSRCTGTFEDGGDGHGKNLEIQHQRPVVDVFHIQFHPVVERNIAAAIDLP